MGAIAKSYMRKGFLIYEEKRKYLVIYEVAVSHIWLCNRSLLDFLIFEDFFLYQCSHCSARMANKMLANFPSGLFSKEADICFGLGHFGTSLMPYISFTIICDIPCSYTVVLFTFVLCVPHVFSNCFLTSLTKEQNSQLICLYKCW